MTRLGLVVRADSGGLGTMTLEAARHLDPHVLLVIAPHNHRPPLDLHRFDDLALHVLHAPIDRTRTIDADVVREFVARSEVAWTAETWYANVLPMALAEADVRSILHVMPEYYDPGDQAQFADQHVLPTLYEAQRPALRGMTWVPVPVALDRFDKAWEARHEPGDPTFWHLPGGARSDRNGTQTVERAKRLADIEVHPLGGGYPDYWTPWEHPGPACLVMPRRYAGLCLPMHEAAAAGACWITTDVEPQSLWEPARWRVSAGHAMPLKLKGGEFNCWQPAPGDVAQALSAARGELISKRAEQIAKQARTWAETQSWGALLPMWRAMIDG